MDDETLWASLFPIEIPVSGAFATSAGVLHRRRVGLVRVTDGSETGWGEAAPYPEQDESFDAMVSSALAGSPTSTLAAALDEALADLTSRRQGRSLGDPGLTTLPWCVAVGIDDAVSRIDDLVDRGVARFKVKVAPGAFHHLVTIRERHPGVVIGVDGNGSFRSLDRHDLGIFHEVGLAFAEELFSDWTTGSAEMFADMTDVPLFADESVRSIEDAGRMLSLPAVAGVTLKPGRLGWGGAQTVADLLTKAGKRWRASSLLETSVGRAFTHRLASHPDAYLSDVAPTTVFFDDDVVAAGAWASELVLPTGPGVGVEPDMEAIERLSVGEPIRFEVPLS